MVNVMKVAGLVVVVNVVKVAGLVVVVNVVKVTGLVAVVKEKERKGKERKRWNGKLKSSCRIFIFRLPNAVCILKTI